NRRIALALELDAQPELVLGVGVAHCLLVGNGACLGMQTFDQALFYLYEEGTISYEEAMRNADSKNELRLRVKLESKRDSAIADQQSESLRIMEEDTAQTF
ncbi:MAG: hypothetical protein AAGE85_10445, partial [Pseudomonadota bacterium]